MLPAALWAILPSVIGVGTKLATRPKKRDYMTDTSYIDKYIANLEGRRSSREVERMAMNPALRAIGTQAAQQRRQIEYESAKYGVRGSGIEAQQKLSAGQQSITAAQEVGERAGAMQIQEGRRIEDYIQRLTMQKGMVEERGKREFQQARRQSRAEIIGGVAQVGVAAGGAITQGIAAKKAAELSTAQFGKYQSVLDKVSGGGDIVEKDLAGLSQKQQERIGNIVRSTTSAERKSLSNRYERLQKTYGLEILTKAAEEFGYKSPDEILEKAQSGEIELSYVENYLKEKGVVSKLSLEETQKETSRVNTLINKAEKEFSVEDADKFKKGVAEKKDPDLLYGKIKSEAKVQEEAKKTEIKVAEAKRGISTIVTEIEHLGGADPTALNDVLKSLNVPLDEMNAEDIQSKIFKLSKTIDLPVSVKASLANDWLDDTEKKEFAAASEKGQEDFYRLAWARRMNSIFNKALGIADIVPQKKSAEIDDFFGGGEEINGA